MTTIPRTLQGKIQFFEQHLPRWSADPGSIGLGAQQVADIAALAEAARTDFDRARVARQAAQSATTLQHGSITSMMRLGTALVATIRAFADATDDEPGVLSRAGLSPVDAPSPAPPPEPVADVSHELLNSGAIRLSWRGTVANGTFYTIWRELEGERSLLGSVSAREFTDTTIPAGTAEATYQLRTHRDELTSDLSEAILVRLGVRRRKGAGMHGTPPTRTATPAQAAAA
ncbi:hypothetical protein MNBD_PLANCTO03-1911 [hydrothermal vent metagenome]|uniref:Fibronectin type-III domain-containing protein n=1 Tax=hydrothermal vent metagenome TaxID=652676 RepID=A0A3B1E0Y2_9ZZZZ